MFVRKALVVLTLIGLILATAAPAAASRGTVDAGFEPITGLHLVGGTTMVFYELGSSWQRGSGVGVATYVPLSGGDPATVEELVGANPFEIFYALSTPDMEIPEVLQEHFENQFAQRPQGWGLSQLETHTYSHFDFCKLTESYVANPVGNLASSMLDGGGFPVVATLLSSGPHSTPADWSVKYSNQSLPTYASAHHLMALTHGDAYYHVMLCREDTVNGNDGVALELAYTEWADAPYSRKVSNGVVHWQLDSVGDQISFMSWPFDSDLSGYNIWEWDLDLDNVNYDDTLHIGSVYEYAGDDYVILP